MLLLGLLGSICLGAFFFILYLFFKGNKKIKALIEKLRKKFVFNFYFRTFIAGYLAFQVAAFTNLKSLSFKSTADVISSIIAINTAIFGIIFPFASFLFIKKNRKKMGEEIFDSFYGTLWLGLDLKRTMSVYYNCLFTFRRLLFAAIVVFMGGYPFLQVQLLLLSSVFAAEYSFIFNPFKDKKQNVLDIINEMTIVLTAYMTPFFTDFVGDPLFRY